MTKRTEVTDEQVLTALTEYFGTGYIFSDSQKRGMRSALEAALNPPPEPEIEVTEEQAQKGLEVFFEEKGDFCDEWRSDMANAYRAMRRLEKPGRPNFTMDGQKVHWRQGEFKPRAILHTHRRKDDP